MTVQNITKHICWVTDSLLNAQTAVQYNSREKNTNYRMKIQDENEFISGKLETFGFR